MRHLLSILALLFSLALQAQDKLFFTDGSVQTGIVVSIAKEHIFFKKSDTSAVQKISKSQLLLLENYRGVRYLFGPEKGAAIGQPADTSMEKHNPRQNYFGIQPFAILLGRGTFVYEHYSANDKVGIVVPLSLTFDPIGLLYNSGVDTNRNALKRISGVNFIVGLDVNFYVGKNKSARFFIGPRARYGTDLFLRGIEGYSLQTQLGWRLEDARGIFTQHISLGFGFVNILSAPGGRVVSPDNFYGWYSINYRLGIRW